MLGESMTEQRRYVLLPGGVTSRNDGQRHYIGPHRLRQLYCIPADAECVMPTDGFQPKPGDIECRPRFDGAYPCFKKVDRNGKP